MANMLHSVADKLHGVAYTATITAFSVFSANFENLYEFFSFIRGKKVFSVSPQKWKIFLSLSGGGAKPQRDKNYFFFKAVPEEKSRNFGPTNTFLRKK